MIDSDEDIFGDGFIGDLSNVDPAEFSVPSSSMLDKAREAPPVDHKLQQENNNKGKKRNIFETKASPKNTTKITKFRLKGKQPVNTTKAKQLSRKATIKKALHDHETLPAGCNVRVKQVRERGKRFRQLKMGWQSLLQVTSQSVFGDQHAYVAVEFLGALLMQGATLAEVKAAKKALIAGDSVTYLGFDVNLKEFYARRPGSADARACAD